MHNVHSQQFENEQWTKNWVPCASRVLFFNSIWLLLKWLQVWILYVLYIPGRVKGRTANTKCQSNCSDVMWHFQVSDVHFLKCVHSWWRKKCHDTSKKPYNSMDKRGRAVHCIPLPYSVPQGCNDYHAEFHWHHGTVTCFSLWLSSFTSCGANSTEPIEALSILKYVVICGKQNISLRGHRDYDKILEAAGSDHKPGNFKAIWNLRVESGDKILQDHLARVGKNATYTSKTIQNELIKVTGNGMCQRILDKVTNPLFYTVLADEVGCVWYWALSLVLWFVSHTGEIKE